MPFRSPVLKTFGGSASEIDASSSGKGRSLFAKYGSYLPIFFIYRRTLFICTYASGRLTRILRRGDGRLLPVPVLEGASTIWERNVMSYALRSWRAMSS